MSEPKKPNEEPAGDGPTLDRWNLYFNRGVQLVGLAIIVNEAEFGNGDLGTYLVASSMMLGAEGLRRLVRGISGGR